MFVGERAICSLVNWKVWVIRKPQELGLVLMRRGEKFHTFGIICCVHPDAPLEPTQHNQDQLHKTHALLRLIFSLCLDAEGKRRGIHAVAMSWKSFGSAAKEGVKVYQMLHCGYFLKRADVFCVLKGMFDTLRFTEMSYTKHSILSLHLLK